MVPCPAITALYVGLVCAAPVEHVVDGDTAYMVFGGTVSHSVRVIGIDTPEQYERGFRAATNAARRAYEGRTITLTIGGAEGRHNGKCYGHTILDRYGRVLARVKGWERVIRRWDKGPWCR